jgi:SAM-dependent methyltransferase
VPEDLEETLGEQVSYYRARATEYDEWWLRQGRYDRGPELNDLWRSEVEEVRRALESFGPAGNVLELACGTGIWTAELVRYAERITAVDASPEVLEINRHRVGTERVRHVRADLFDWEPDVLYDVVFFGFWLSHVPPERFDYFWSLVRSALGPGGRFFFVDSLPSGASSAKDHPPGEPDGITLRKLNDGREFRIYKVFHDPGELEARLDHLGWDARVRATENYFIHGHGSPRG